MEYLKKVQMDSLDISSLSEDKKKQILALKDSITMTDESIIDFGSSATKKLSEYSSTTLKSIKLKDFPEIDNIMTELVGELEKVDSNTLLSYKAPFYKKLFGFNSLETFIKNFENQFMTVSGVIEGVKKKLEDAKYQLKKDVILCDQSLEQNLQYINDLDDCIFAGRMKLKECQQELKEEITSLDKEDSLAVQILNMKQGMANRLEMNLSDLYLIRENAIQNRYQLGLIKDGDIALIDKIKSSINMAIPTWEANMIVSFAIARQQSGVDLQKLITEVTNRLILMNSEILKTGAIRVATELQRGIIDIETLKKSNENLIETLDGVRQVNKEGKANREKAIDAFELTSNNRNEITLISAN